MHRCPESFKLRCAALLASALLSGCMSVPVPELPAQVPAAWSQAAGEGARAVDLRSWWTALDDPRLNALVEEALRRNLDLEQSARLLQGEREVAGRWRSRYLPGGRRPPGAGRPGQGFLFPRQHRHGLGAGPVRRGREQQAAGRRGRRPGRRSRAGPARVGGRGRGAQLSGPGRGQRSDRAADADGRAGPRGRAAGAGAAEHPPGHAAGRRHGQRAPAAHPGRAGVDAPGGRPVGARAGAAAGPRRAGSRLERGGAVAGPARFRPGEVPADLLRTRPDIREAEAEVLRPPQGWAWRARRCIRA